MVIDSLLCLGAHAQARYMVVCLCLCVCVDCYRCSRMNQVQVRVSIGFLSCLLGLLFVDFQNNASFSSYAYTWNAIAAFSEEHVAKLVYRVLLRILYLVVSSALKR